jgi:hypothetical protein
MSLSNIFFHNPDDNLPPLQPFATGTVESPHNSPSPPSPPIINEANLNDVFLPWYNQYNSLPQTPNHDVLGTSFFDHILNPAGFDYGGYSPFAYQPLPSPYTTPNTAAMPPSTRTNPEGSQRPARLPNGYVDLTATPDSPPRRRKRDSSSPGPSNKRQKQEQGTAAKGEGAEPPDVEEVDLTDDAEPIQEILQKQRAEAVKAQEKPVETRTTFNTFTCVICMDTPTDLTATACGTYSYPHGYLHMLTTF